MNKKVNEVFLGFQKYSENFLNDRLRKKMLDVCNEHPDYVADELLLLSEEILSQVSAYGVCLYLQKGGILQTEKNNDYILHDLFLHDGHQNAGPVFYNVRNLVQELTAVLSDKQNELFNSESDINKKLQELAAFRNALMHGFFKLPAERNLELVKEIQIILEKLLKYYEIFKHKGDFHFWKKEGFSGHWFIQENNDWDSLSGNYTTSFQKLASRAKEELNSVHFINAISVTTDSVTNIELAEKLEGFINKNKSKDFKESLYVQFHPQDKKQQDELYKSTYTLLSQKKDIELLSYTIDENGIGYTSYLLIHHLLKNLGLQTNEKDPKKKVKSKVAEIKNKGKKLVILINNIHLVPFASEHITSLIKFFKESKIYFIGIGWAYEHLNYVFSQKIDLMEERKEKNERNVIPNDMEVKQLIKNHTRHRGPYEKEDDYNGLEALIEHIIQQLKKKKEIKARELADETIKGKTPDIELINEALYILYPYFKYDQLGKDNNYIKDELDEVYGFPKTQTETSSIFLTLGRRDIDLEYKHKILKP